MTEAITSQFLRLVIWAKIEAGLSRRSISELIHQFVNPHVSEVERIAVERIEARDRSLFLNALVEREAKPAWDVIRTGTIRIDGRKTQHTET